jgi:putative transposase
MTHFIFVYKYRKRLLIRLGDQVKRLLCDIADENDFEIVEIEVDKDHVHLLTRYKPSQSVLQVARLLKQISTFRLWRTAGNLPYLRNNFWRERTFWSDGYFACSIGNASAATIQNYIRNQG